MCYSEYKNTVKNYSEISVLECCISDLVIFQCNISLNNMLKAVGVIMVALVVM